MHIYLPDPQATIDLGKRLSGLIPKNSPPSILLQGELGAGKTTLVRALVKSLDGGEEAEVSSPSFNLVNIYPTIPEVAHIDLYRVPFGEIEEDILDYIFDPAYLSIVEWIDHIPDSTWPRDYLYISFEFNRSENGQNGTKNARSAVLSGNSLRSKQILEALTS